MTLTNFSRENNDNNFLEGVFSFGEPYEYFIEGIFVDILEITFFNKLSFNIFEGKLPNNFIKGP